MKTFDICQCPECQGNKAQNILDSFTDEEHIECVECGYDSRESRLG